MEKLLLPHEVAEILRVKTDTLRIWRSRKKGPIALRVGGRCLYPQSAVEAFIQNLKEESDERYEVPGQSWRRAV